MSDVVPLQPVEARVLGTLIEKELTTPDGYPLSLNALVNGCNQKSNRDPVTGFGSADVEAALRDLRLNHLAVEMTTSGARVLKYAHRADERLELQPPGLAVLAELLLRGPQTPGELRGRAARMAELPDLAALDRVLDVLRERRLVTRLEPLPGSRSARWMQLLAPDLHDTGGAAPASGPAPSPSPPTPDGSGDPPARSTPRVAEPAGLAARLADLEARVARLEARLGDASEH